MSEVEELVVRWRRQLAAHPSLTAEDIEELETHLRDLIDAFVAQGSPPQEAVYSATRQLGDPASVVGAFEQLRRVPERIRYLAAVLTALFIGAFTLASPAFSLVNACVVTAATAWVLTSSWSRFPVACGGSMKARGHIHLRVVLALLTLGGRSTLQAQAPAADPFALQELAPGIHRQSPNQAPCRPRA